MSTEERHPRAWWGWGLAERHEALPESARALLEQALGIPRRDAPPVAHDAVRLPASALDGAMRRDLAAVVGAENVRDDRAARLLHAAGRSTVDLLRLRAGDASAAPDAVVLPASHEEVAGVLAACARLGVAVVPFGGGTSVVGGLAALRDGLGAVVSMDLERLDRVVGVDLTSRTATLEAGMRAVRAEEELGRRGLTLGHFPQSFEHASVGGFAATRSSGQASAGYGRFDDMVVALRIATPEGDLRLGRAPASAAGPDLRQLFLGSEGALGVITEVTVRVRTAPEVTVDDGWAFDAFEDGSAALRRLAQDGPLPTVLRLSDEAETAVGVALGDPLMAPAAGGGCVAVAGYEGAAVEVAARRAACDAVLTAAGGRPLGTVAGEAWRRGRYRGPYVRDALLDVGALAETLETATSWSNLPRLLDAVRTALETSLADPGRPFVLCHVSHVYPDGASLYFTAVAAQGDDPVARWQAAKRAATVAIVAAGGTITHHHAVGVDHRDWMRDEVGELGVEVLRAVKRRLDPRGILNPGKLIPPEG